MLHCEVPGCRRKMYRVNERASSIVSILCMGFVLWSTVKICAEVILVGQCEIQSITLGFVGTNDCTGEMLKLP